MEDENYSILKDEAIKAKQALEYAFTEKEAHKEKLVSTYKLFSKSEDEMKAIFLEIESDRKNTGLPVDEEYNNSYWKWKDADEANEIAQTKLSKYEMNMTADIPDVMIELKEVKEQNEELKNEVQRQNEELKKEMQEVQSQNEELKKEMQEMKEILPQMMMQCLREYTKIQFFSNITPPFNGQKEVDIFFPEPVKARTITFKPKAWNKEPILRCEVYVNGQLQNTPFNQRSISSYSWDGVKDSTMNAEYGWRHISPLNTNEWLKLNLQQVKTITGIRVGTRKDDAKQYVSNFALEFGN